MNTAILFDLDGTILNTDKLIKKHLLKYLRNINQNIY